MNADLQILDTTLRDGSYCIDFQFTADDTALLASALDAAGIGMIEVAHGLGLGAARAGKGEQAATDEAYLRAAAGAVRNGRFGAFFIPGIGAADDLRLAADCGMHFVRIGTNITELDEAKPFVAEAKRLGLWVCCNLMKSYAVPPREFGARCRQVEGFGADAVCLVDSAGGMLPEEIRAYIEAALAAASLPVGFHGHDNLSLAVANSLEAGAAGAAIVDTSLRGLGRSEGNAVTEVVAAILQKRGLLPNVDVNALLDASEAFVAPLMHGPRRSAIGITTGRARFHSSFLGRAMRAAGEYGVDARELILRLGERDQIDAPEELVTELALELARRGPRTLPDLQPAEARPAGGGGLEQAVAERARELKEQGRKLGLPAVLNVVVSPYEPTHVSPFVETAFGVAISNVMLGEPGPLEAVLRAADPLVDYVLLDSGGTELQAGLPARATLLTYSDRDMWAHAAAVHLAKLVPGALAGKGVALAGPEELVLRLALALDEMGAEVATEDVLPLAEAACEADVVVGMAPRTPIIGREVVEAMRPDALLYDAGIGSIAPDGLAEAERRGLRAVRIDMRPTLAATALELIGMRRLVAERMGRAGFDGVGVVAGGLIGHAGEVVVDSIGAPSRVIGVADGRGGILPADPEREDVRRVRRHIVRRRMERAAE